MYLTISWTFEEGRVAHVSICLETFVRWCNCRGRDCRERHEGGRLLVGILPAGRLFLLLLHPVLYNLVLLFDTLLHDKLLLRSV